MTKAEKNRIKKTIETPDFMTPKGSCFKMYIRNIRGRWFFIYAEREGLGLKNNIRSWGFLGKPDSPADTEQGAIE